MRYTIAAATVITLIVGIATGFALTATVFEAEAKPPPPGPQPVEEQNLDGSGFIAVHEQGVADVNVVPMPSQASGPLEFTTIQTKLCTISPTGFCDLEPDTLDTLDVNAILTTLSSEGWDLVEVSPIDKVWGSNEPAILYTLSRQVP